MKKVVRLTESDLIKLVKRIVKEQNVSNSISDKIGQIEIFDDKANTEKLGTYEIIKIEKIDGKLELTLKGDESSKKIPGEVILFFCATSQIDIKKQPCIMGNCRENIPKSYKPIYLNSEGHKKLQQLCRTKF